MHVGLVYLQEMQTTVPQTHDEEDAPNRFFNEGTELSVGLASRKKVWNDEHRLERRRGRGKVVWTEGGYRMKHHRNPRNGRITEELQEADDSGNWNRVFIRPARMKMTTTYDMLRDLVAGDKVVTDACRLPVKTSQENYEQRTTALGFAAQATMDWLGKDSAVFVTFLYDALLIDEANRQTSRGHHRATFIDKLADLFPGGAIWLVGGEEVIVRKPSMNFLRFMKDVRLGFGWSGSKDVHRSAKKKASASLLPRWLRSVLRKSEGEVDPQKWVVPHCHAILVVIGPDGRVIPPADVMSKIASCMLTARHQLRAEHVGDKVEVENARSFGEHGISILEYLHKDGESGTEQKKQQEKWRQGSRNSGLFDEVIDTRNPDRSDASDDGRLNAFLKQFLRVRRAAHVASGIDKHHHSAARSIKQVMEASRDMTTLVPSFPSNNSLSSIMKSPVNLLVGIVRSLFGKQGAEKPYGEGPAQHGPP